MAIRSTCAAIRANNDITQDGVRDSAQYSRTDPFNLQQIEIYNGANSVFNGSGSVGGTINLVSKVPQARRSHHPLGARSAPTIITAPRSTSTGGSAT